MDVLIFARVSHDASGVVRSVDEQVNDCADWARREGWNVVHVIRELGSASEFSSRKRRAEWDEALEWIESGRIHGLLSWENSRATRDLSAYTQLRAACRANNVFWGYGGTVYDLSQRGDRFRTALDALLAEDESGRTSERILRAVRANADSGRPHGKALWGYKRRYHPETKALLEVLPDPETAPLVQEAARRVLGGETLYAIASDFNARGVEPRRPKRKAHTIRQGWTGVAIKQMLATPSYAGLRSHNGQIAGAAIWPPLIERQDWDRLQRILFDPGRRRDDAFRVGNLLTGIARCGHPGCVAVVAMGMNNSRLKVEDRYERVRYRTYVCADSFHMSMMQKYADAIVEAHVLKRLERPDSLAQLHNGQDENVERRRELMSEIDGHRSWLADVKRRAEQERRLDILFDQELLVHPKIQAAEAELRRLTTAHPDVLLLAEATDVRGAWASRSLAAKRMIVRNLVDVALHPAIRRGTRGLQQAIDRTEIRWLVD